MANYFVFNNISSLSLGVRIKNKNIYSAPKYDISLVSIPGRDGELIGGNERFPNVTISYSCFIVASSIEDLETKLRNVKKWLYSDPGEYHSLTDSYAPNFVRKAVFNSKLDISDQVKRIGVFTISFSCHPFRYLLEGLDTLEINTSPATIHNPYPFVSKPYLKIYGNGSGTLTIQNDKGNFIWNFTGLDGYIECDSEMMNFYKGTVLKNSSVTGNGFITFAGDDNVISFSGGITKIEIIPRWVSL